MRLCLSSVAVTLGGVELCYHKIGMSAWGEGYFAVE
jgi:hypothetical protein